MLYVLGGSDGKQPVGVEDVREWGRWFQNTEHRVVAQETVNGVLVSTVFLGIDHNWFGKGPPILFESMVFLPGDGELQQRYATWDEALAGHQQLSKLIRELNDQAGAITREALKLVAMRANHEGERK